MTKITPIFLTLCSCEPGRQLVGHSCQDVDECVFQPCLHGGTCYNLTPGYHCLCGPAHTGDNCEWTKLPAHTNPLTAPMAIAAVTLSVIIVVVLGVLLTIRLHRYRTARGEEGVTDVLGTPMVVQAVSGNPQSKAVKEENILLGSLKIKRSGKITLSLEGPDHIITPLRLPTIGVEAIGIKEANIIGSTLKHSGSENKIKECPTTCISVVCPTSACPTTSGAQVITDAIENSAPPLLAQDDLRAYAYEGDGSPSGSLTSTVLGLRTDSLEGDSLRPLIPEYGEVFDLLKNLPDAVNSLKPSQDTSGNCTDVEKLVAISSNPKLIQNAVNIT
ncbi:putative neural-cadherin 2 isoform X2 [Cherax quadricarinatus]|uniref:putative neural-cadherin 2 isoform X2 n=1 Tax=Cherax quadricarinatus TaxID=27406 RepID=UPI00387E7922